MWRVTVLSGTVLFLLKRMGAPFLTYLLPYLLQIEYYGFILWVITLGILSQFACDRKYRSPAWFVVKIRNNFTSITCNQIYIKESSLVLVFSFFFHSSNTTMTTKTLYTPFSQYWRNWGNSCTFIYSLVSKIS